MSFRHPHALRGNVSLQRITDTSEHCEDTREVPLIHSPCSRAQLGVSSCCCSEMLFATGASSLTRNPMSPLLAHQAADVGSAKGPHSGMRRRRSRKGGSQLSLTMGTMVKISLQKGMESPCTSVPWFWEVQTGREGCSPRGGTTPCSLGTPSSLSSSCLCSL